jgi:ABC-type proline/glycine betaine transport system permease subunit
MVSLGVAFGRLYRYCAQFCAVLVATVPGVPVGVAAVKHDTRAATAVYGN